MSKLLILLIGLMLLSQSLFPQDKDLKVKLKQANEAFNQGNYLLADSLYTLCVSKSINGGIYYNRALTRMFLNDSCGFCDDLEAASWFLDKEAERLFKLNCYKSIDTVFYSKDLLKIDKSQKYRYYDVKFKRICDTLSFIDYHDLKKKKVVSPMNLNMLMHSVNPPRKSMDIIGKAYLKDDTTKIFYYVRDVSKYDIIKENFSRVNELTQSLNEKYTFLKENNDENKTLIIKLTLNKNGKFSNIKLMETKYINRNLDSFKELESDIYYFFRNIQTIKPVVFQNSAVNYEFVYLLNL